MGIGDPGWRSATRRIVISSTIESHGLSRRLLHLMLAGNEDGATAQGAAFAKLQSPPRCTLAQNNLRLGASVQSATSRRGKMVNKEVAIGPCAIAEKHAA